MIKVPATPAGLGALEDLAAHGVAGPFDGILAAYLLRNLPDVDAGVADLRDLLAPGAPLAVHEYSVADSAAARAVWTAVCWAILRSPPTSEPETSSTRSPARKASASVSGRS